MFLSLTLQVSLFSTARIQFAGTHVKLESGAHSNGNRRFLDYFWAKLPLLQWWRSS
jgi:hypothetical protein